MDPKAKVQGHLASATLKTPPLPPMPKPTIVELDGKKYSILLIPMEMDGLLERAQKQGWYNCVHTSFEGYGYHVMTKNHDEISEIGIQFLDRTLDEVLKKKPQISPPDIRRYAAALEKIHQPKSTPGNFEKAQALKGKEVVVEGKVYEVIAIPYKSYGELGPLAIRAGYKTGLIIPGEGETLIHTCEMESCHYILIRAESTKEAQHIALELLKGNYKPKT